MHGRCNFFCHQKKRKVKLDKVREGLRPITLCFRTNARKLILGSIGTPLDHLSVKNFFSPDLQADSKIVHFICREWLRPPCYRLVEVVLGHFVQAGPIRTIRVFLLGKISYTNKQTNHPVRAAVPV